MGLRFFADHCVPTFILSALRGSGHDVVRLTDHLPPESPDPIVIAKAQELNCILISLNGDFADIVTYPPPDYGGIIAVQLRNHPEVLANLMERLLAYLAAHEDPDHYRGKLLLAEAHRIRVWE